MGMNALDEKKNEVKIDPVHEGMCIEQLLACVADEDDWTPELEAAAQKAASVLSHK
jgi:hypothetical protein